MPCALFCHRATAIRDRWKRYRCGRAALSILQSGTGNRSPVLTVVTLPMPSRTAHAVWRSAEHTSELQSLMRISYAVFCLKKKKKLTHCIIKSYSIYGELSQRKLTDLSNLLY